MKRSPLKRKTPLKRKSRLRCRSKTNSKPAIDHRRSYRDSHDVCAFTGRRDVPLDCMHIFPGYIGKLCHHRANLLVGWRDIHRHQHGERDRRFAPVGTPQLLAVKRRLGELDLATLEDISGYTEGWLNEQARTVLPERFEL